MKHKTLLIVLGASAAAGLALGIFLIAHGDQLASRNWTYSSTPWVTAGVASILLPLLASWIAGLVILIRTACRWRRSLTPQQRAVLDAGLVAAATVTDIELWRAMRGHSARAGQSALGTAPLSSVAAGIMTTTERLGGSR